ncbi:MAG: hypothetical protein ACRCZF_06385, partial [Gemmataceae bacterium]
MRATLDRWAPIVVLIVWTISTFVAIAQCGVDFPYMDEWPTIDVLEGRSPLGPWLVEWHNEHFLPLPRLLYWGLYQLTHDFRAGMVTSALLMTITVARFQQWLRRWSGRPSWRHAIVPLLFLGPAHAENWLMSYQLCFVLSVVLTLELVIASHKQKTCTIAGLAVALALCGSHGLLLALPFALMNCWH